MPFLKKLLGILLIVVACLAWLSAVMALPQLLRGGDGAAAYNLGYKMGQLFVLLFLIGGGGGLFLLGRRLMRPAPGPPQED